MAKAKETAEESAKTKKTTKQAADADAKRETKQETAVEAPKATKTAAKKVADKPAAPETEPATEAKQAPEAEAIAEAESKATTKAGKHSAKALREQAEEEAKEARKQAKAQAEADGEEAPKKPAPKTRTRLERRGKQYRKAAEIIEKDKEHTFVEALEKAIKSSTTKFDATVELHVNLSVDPRHADQNIRGNLVLPSGTGRSVRVAVFAEADDAAAAKKAGADIAASDDFLKQLDKGTIDFDVLIATPTVMAKLGKYARLLGPKGLMPNPKSGTVTKDVTKAVSEAKAGRVEYRVDATGIVHVGVGKVSFGQDKLMANVKAVASSIKGAKPASVKGTYVKSIHLTTTMGPSIKVSINEL